MVMVWDQKLMLARWLVRTWRGCRGCRRRAARCRGGCRRRGRSGGRQPRRAPPPAARRADCGPRGRRSSTPRCPGPARTGTGTYPADYGIHYIQFKNFLAFTYFPNKLVFCVLILRFDGTILQFFCMFYRYFPW